MDSARDVTSPLAGVVCAAELRLGAVAMFLTSSLVTSVVAVVLTLAHPPLRNATHVVALEVSGRALHCSCVTKQTTLVNYYTALMSNN